MKPEAAWQRFIGGVQKLKKNKKHGKKDLCNSSKSNKAEDMNFKKLHKKLEMLLGGKNAPKRQPPIETLRVITETRSLEEVIRRYGAHFDHQFGVDSIDSSGRQVTNVTSRVLKILGQREDLDEEQRKAMEVFCGNRKDAEPAFTCQICKKCFANSTDLGVI